MEHQAQVSDPPNIRAAPAASSIRPIAPRVQAAAARQGQVAMALRERPLRLIPAILQAGRAAEAEAEVLQAQKERPRVAAQEATTQLRRVVARAGAVRVVPPEQQELWEAAEAEEQVQVLAQLAALVGQEVLAPNGMRHMVPEAAVAAEVAAVDLLLQ